MSKYCSYEFRASKEIRESLTSKEKDFMLILMAFGVSIDPHGYDDGNYDEAMRALLSASNKGLKHD